MKHFFIVGDKVRLYRKFPMSNVEVGEEGEVTHVLYEDDGDVMYVVFFHTLYREQIIYQPYIARVKE